MAARATGKSKQATPPRSSAKGGGKTKSTRAKNTSSRKSSSAEPPKVKAAATKESMSNPSIGPATSDTSEFLREQNAALRAELEQAKARVIHLEQINKNVINRIDWLIDSLQSIVKR